MVPQYISTFSSVQPLIHQDICRHSNCGPRLCNSCPLRNVQAGWLLVGDLRHAVQGECSFLADLEEPIKSIMSFEPGRALPAGSAPGPSTQNPSIKKVTPTLPELVQPCL